MENACVFCKIVKGEMPADIVDQSKNFVVFPDINPHAPVHLLIVPKVHYKDLSEIDSSLWEEVRQLVLRMAKEGRMGGFRLANNYGDSAMVHHFHVHFLGNINSQAQL